MISGEERIIFTGKREEKEIPVTWFVVLAAVVIVKVYLSLVYQRLGCDGGGGRYNSA